MRRVIRRIGMRIERRLHELGPIWSTIALTFCAVMAALSIHILLHNVMQGQTLTWASVFNLTVEVAVIATPMILYSRSVIRALDKSHVDLKAMSQRLTATAQQAVEASRAKSAFLANMSHELRTPLNAILGFSEIMKDQHLGPVSNARYLGYAADIHSSGRHLLGIINDVLDLAKIESGKMTLDDTEEFQVAPTLQTAMVMLVGLGERHGVKVQEDWSDQDMRLVAVPRMVRQVVINLVGNAIKFTPAGGQVTLSGSGAPDGGYRLCVKDSGIGMNEKEIAVALIPFGQNHNKMAGRREGTGLGLPLAKAMMELHGGTLTIESEPNQGTAVTLIFPADRVLPAEGQQAA